MIHVSLSVRASTSDRKRSYQIIGVSDRVLLSVVISALVERACMLNDTCMVYVCYYVGEITCMHVCVRVLGRYIYTVQMRFR